MYYDYKKLTEDIKAITEKNEAIKSYSIGKSVIGRDILCLETGCGKKKLFLNGAHHGLEYLTAAFLMKFCENYADGIVKGMYTDFFNKVTLYVVPMVNPDGVDIAVNGLDLSEPIYRDLINKVGLHSFTSVWQANARGVDINHNYDAGWLKTAERPSPTKYGGEYPESEPETRAITDFVRREDFDMLIAFHSQGGEIYYDFQGAASAKARELAEKFSQRSGYTVCRPTGTASYGGCKDWFIEKFGREGFTVEMGRGKNPLPLEMLDEIYDENAAIIFTALEEI